MPIAHIPTVEADDHVLTGRQWTRGCVGERGSTSPTRSVRLRTVLAWAAADSGNISVITAAAVRNGRSAANFAVIGIRNSSFNIRIDIRHWHRAFRPVSTTVTVQAGRAASTVRPTLHALA